MSKDKFLDHIAGVSLFSQCSKKDLQTIAQTLTDIDLDAGTTLINQGEHASSFMVIMSGEIDIIRDGTLVATVGAGAMIGEMAILMDRPRTATAVAKTDTEVLIGERRNFDGLLDSVPGLAQKLLHSLALRIADNEDQAHH